MKIYGIRLVIIDKCFNADASTDDGNDNQCNGGICFSAGIGYDFGCKDSGSNLDDANKDLIKIDIESKFI